jgi:hypothetical protein
MPCAAEIDLEPGRKIPDSPWWRRSHVTEIARAIPRWNIQGAAKRDGQMREIAAYTRTLAESLRGRSSGARILIIESDVVVNVIADCLHPVPARLSLAEKVPGSLREQVRFAVPAAQQKDQSLFRQVLDGMLLRGHHVNLRLTAIAYDRVGRDSHPAGRRHNPVTPVPETIAISRNGYCGIGCQVIRRQDIRRPRIVDIQGQYHGRRLRKIVN